MIFKNSEWLIFSSDSAIITKTEFTAENVKSATLYITALGYFRAGINEKAINDYHFIPAMTDYEERDLSKINMPIFDKLSHRIYYHSFDITSLLKDGKNTLNTHIGAGWYGQKDSPNEGMPYWGDNTLVFSLKITHKDDTVSYVNSDTNNTFWQKSYITKTSLYYGEMHDLRLFDNEFTADKSKCSWKKASKRSKPIAVLKECFFPIDKCVRTIKPKVISTFGDRIIYDLGELASGYAVIKFLSSANINDLAQLRYADELNEDGSLNFHYCGGSHRMQQDFFVYDNRLMNKLFHPVFTWHAARYIELTGKAEIIEYFVIQTDIKKWSDFHCDNETLQWIFDAYVKTQQANIHGCIPSDCPHRERLGYTGDGQLTCGAVMSIFDAREMYKKWMADIRDCQCKISGHVQHTAPFYGGGGGPGGWGGAAVILPFRYYKFYNDISILQESYSSMCNYIKYMLTRLENGIITHEEENGWCLGDWCPIDNKILIPESFVNTYFFAKCLDMTAQSAKILNYHEDAYKYSMLSKEIKNNIIKHFYNESSCDFCDGVQGANAFAIDLGLGNEKTKANLVKKYNDIKTFDTGIFGTDLVIRVLFSLGECNLAFDLLTNEKVSSFYNMKKHGATTLWENWDGCDSRCHPMFGAVCEYFFSEILGIKQLDEAGFNNICITPANISKLKKIKGSMGTPLGTISVEIDRTKNENQITINCPPSINVQAINKNLT